MITLVKSKPRVAVILPTYNRSEWLQEALESLLKQDQQVDLHLCLVKNGCNDNGATDNVLRNYLIWFEDVTLMDYEHNDVANISKIHRYVRPDEYVVEFADDDVMCSSNLIDKVIHLERNTRCPFVASPALCINDSGALTGDLIGVCDGDIDFASMFHTCKVVMSSVMWQPGVFGLHTDCPQSCGGEWPHYLEAIYKHGPAGYLNTPTVKLRIHKKSDTNQRGISGGRFIDMHMNVWSHWIDRGYRVDDAMWNSMFSTIANLSIKSFGIGGKYIDNIKTMLDIKRRHDESH